MHVGTPRVPLIKSKDNDKSYKYYVKIKLCKDLVSEMSDLYEFKMALFDYGDPEELFFSLVFFSDSRGIRKDC